MKIIDKLKNVFFEEVEEDDEEELPKTFAKKVEIPKKEVELPKKEEKISEEINISPVLEEEKEDPIEETNEFPMMFDEDDFLEDKVVEPENNVSYHREDRNDQKELYHGKKEVSYVESVNKPDYSYTKSYYEEKETRGFKPSPIISPIYGILDKNYHSEEVVTKKETRIVSSYNKPDLDSVRNKAFGSDEKTSTRSSNKNQNDNYSEKDDQKVYDVNSNKPQVSKVTIADADEYYNDLGLAYNVDYSDASRNTTRSMRYNQKDKKRNKNDDNLFDLIDSMYNKED